MQTRSITCVLSVFLSYATLSTAQQKPITGYNSSETAAQLQLETRFDKLLSAAEIGDNIKYYSA